MGWAWTMNAGRAQSLTGQFLQRLRYDQEIERARTVRQARLQLIEDTYVDERQSNQEAKLMKIYGEIENVIDISRTGGVTP